MAAKHEDKGLGTELSSLKKKERDKKESTRVLPRNTSYQVGGRPT